MKIVIIKYNQNNIMMEKNIIRRIIWNINRKDFYKKNYKPNTKALIISGFIGIVPMLSSQIIDKDKKFFIFKPHYYDCLIENISNLII